MINRSMKDLIKFSSFSTAVAYSRWTKKACETIGILFECRNLKREDLEEEILKANKDESINGKCNYVLIRKNYNCSL